MIQKICLSIGVSLLLISTGFSQITVKDEVTTDSVNLFTQYEQSVKSSKLAMAASLVLPGTGHQYLGRSNSALGYLAVDIFALMGAVFAEKNSRRLYSDSKGFAGLYADAKGNSKDGRYWQMIGEFDDSRSYNAAIQNNRDFDNLFNSADNYWYWANTDDRKKYNDIRKSARRYHLASSICVGAMVLNRVIAIVDIRASTKYRVGKKVSQIQVTPSISSDLSSAGFLINTQF